MAMRMMVTRTSQTGAAFANLALGITAIGSVAAVTADWTAEQSALALQQQQGYVFATLNDSVGNYMTLLFPRLTEKSAAGIDAIPEACARLPYRYGTSVAVEPEILTGKCRLKIPLLAGGDYVVENAFQPTLADLKQLGLLDRGVSELPILATDAVVAGPDATGAASSSLAPSGYVISISPKCIGVGASASGCSNTNLVLTSSIINVQPFAQSRYIQNFMPVMWAAGPDAAMSGPPDADNVLVQAQRTNPTGEFRSVQAGWSRENPVTRTWSYTTSSGSTSYLRGVDNIVLMRNGYESAYWQLARRDGSSPPTANWDFNGKDLTGVGKLAAKSLEVSGNSQIGGDQTVKGNQSVEGNQVIQGELKVNKTATIQGILTAMSDLVIRGAAELRGQLTVTGSALFKDNVQIEKNLSVSGNTQLSGSLSGTTASFSGVLTADGLVIGNTSISRDGTLLGARSGWGVTTGTPCGTNLALAQSTDGKIQICRNSAWTALILNENVVSDAPGAGTSCAPEGAPGRLPDGTLAVCRHGTWQSTAQGTVAEGGSCSVEGALATEIISPSNNVIVLGCQGGTWSRHVFTKPKLAFVDEGFKCQMDDEIAFNGKGHHTMLVCKGGTWQVSGTQLQSGFFLGGDCAYDGILASDIERTGLLVCRSGKWSKITDPVSVGTACKDEGREVVVRDGSSDLGNIIYCVNGRWSLYPSTLKLARHDGFVVEFIKQVEINGEYYFLYSESGWSRGKPVNMASIGYTLFGNRWPSGTDPVHIGNDIAAYRRCASGNLSGHYFSDPGYDRWGAKGLYEVCLATDRELYAINWKFNGRPSAWNFEFEGGAEVWTARRVDDGCSDWGCDIAWSNHGAPVSWWDHVTVDIWNNHTFKRWNSDERPAIMKIRRAY